MLIIYLAIVAVTVYYAVKILLPEMNKPSAAVKVDPYVPAVASAPVPVPVVQEFRRSFPLEDQIIPMVLPEKDREISRLQMDIKILQTAAKDFDKVKTVLEDEIKRLREQNRMFRSELGLPTVVQPKANQVV